MHRRRKPIPQPDPADAGKPPEPAVPDSSDPTSKADVSGEQTVAEELGRLIIALEEKMQGVELPDDPLGEAGQKYDALVAWYKEHIAAAQAKLNAMRSS
ncbi:MAG: hypothetical protein ABI047_01695 [Jatrophihabitantaceae bacterium]